MDVTWPESGVWSLEVPGEPLDVAAELLDDAAPADPLAEPGAHALVPDGRAAERLRARLRRRSGMAGVRSDRVVTAGRLPGLLLGDEAPAERVGEVLVAEIARAVDQAVRAAPEAFPRLAAFAPGPGLPGALARLFEDLRRAGLDSRAPGAVATLERLEPAGLGQELLRAIGMFEGTLERIDRIDAIGELELAAERADAVGPVPWIVAGFGHASLPLVELLRRLSHRAPVLWLLAVGTRNEAGADREALRPGRRSLAWAGAARWRAGEDAIAARAASPATLRVRAAAGPPDVADAAVETALAEPATTVLLATRPEAWTPLLDEAGARHRAVLVGERGGGDPGPALRWVQGVVEAWAGEPTAARIVDLLALHAHLDPSARGSSGDPEARVARADAAIRARGARRGREAILEALGYEGAPLVRAFERLDAAEDAPGALRAVAALVDDLRPWARLGGEAAVPAHLEGARLERLRALLEDLAERLPGIWPEAPAHTPELLRARLADALRACTSERSVAVPPPPGDERPPIRLQSLDAPLPPGTANAIVLGLAEADLDPAGASTHLIPDGVRAAGPVAAQAHWPWHADGVAARRARIEALRAGPGAAGAGPRHLEVLQPIRDLRGEEFVPWSGLPAPEAPAPGGSAGPIARPREPKLRPPEVGASEATRPRPERVERAAGLRGRRADAPGPGLSPTAVDGYRACPRRFYFERLLGAADREPPGYDVDPRQRGDWAHGLLRRLFRRRPGWWRRPDGPPDAATVRGMLEALADGGGSGETELVAGASAAFLGLQRERLLDGLADAMARHGEALAATPGETPVGLELALHARVETDEAGPLPLRGRLDRLDLVVGPEGHARGLVVVDYKAGEVDAYAARRGREAERKVQLLLYARMAEQQLGVPCLAALAVPVRGGQGPRGVVCEDPEGPDAGGWPEVVPKGDRLTRAGFVEAMERAVAHAGAVAAGLRGGRFPPEPHPPQQCDHCPHALHCPRMRSG